MIIIILGMHKSGTTLVSKILHQSDVDMGEFDETVGYDHGNHYERLEMQEINKKILKCNNDLSDDVISPIYEVANHNDISVEIKNLSLLLSEKHENWGAKDPRTCLTYAYWEKFLSHHKVLVVFRNPEEVFWHYLKYIPRYKVLGRILKGYKTLKAWYIYNNETLHVKNSDIMRFEYSDFMTNDKAIKELSEFVGSELQDCRDKSMYRAKIKGGILYSLCLFLNRLRGRNILKLYSEMKALV